MQRVALAPRAMTDCHGIFQPKQSQPVPAICISREGPKLLHQNWQPQTQKPLEARYKKKKSPLNSRV